MREDSKAAELIENIEATVKTLTFLVKELEKETPFLRLDDVFADIDMKEASKVPDLIEVIVENGEDG